jgi:molybdate transport system regulatory protein
MKVSARHTFSGTIAKVNKGAVNAEVDVQLTGGTRLTPVVTNGSVERLHLAVGDPVSAAFKASSVILAAE